jgi:PAS domain S-box-containing protein
MDKLLHVLIVEDSEDDTLLIVYELKQAAYEPAYERVETAGAMRSALGRQAWDVVISDYTMPQFSALAALQVLKESGRDLPFIIVSGTIGEETAVAAMKAGAHDYIMKNNLARLLPAIERELHEADVRRQRKQAERELWESEEKYRILVENANDAIFIDQDEKIKFPNPRTLNLTGYSAEELSRIPFLQLIHPDERDMNLEEHRRGDGREKVSGVYSFRVINRAGEELWVQLNAVPIIWEGRPATLNFLRDITKVKELETQFLQAQKMEAIGQLVGGFVHDFNNFLTLIKVCSQLSLMDLKEGDPLREKWEMIHGATERSATLARQLLAFAAVK